MSSEYSGESERLITARCVLLSLLCAVALKSQAQVVSTPSSNASGDALAEIVVTATKRGAESVQTIPIAITAISQAELEARGAQEFEDYARSVPALSFVDAGPAFKTYVIRGINATGTGVATVGQYVDDILITGDLRQPDLRLYDIQRIEVSTRTAGHSLWFRLAVRDYPNDHQSTGSQRLSRRCHRPCVGYRSWRRKL